MASQTQTCPVDPDTLITVKVSFKGGIRRFKLPLRELGPTVLPSKLRQSLSIAEDKKVVFERYSDSAAAFVTLDSKNVTVYKQLYRAAKAKLKLRLKATITNEEPAVSTGEINKPCESSTTADATKSIDEAVAEAVMKYFNGPDYAEKLSSSIRLEVEKQSRIVSTAPSIETNPVPCLIPRLSSTSYMVCCNNCDEPIHGMHYHCGICDNGDYDLCQTCVDNKGIHCDEGHWLIKRHLENGKFVNSTTETCYKRTEQSTINTRTCNCCVKSFPEDHFVTCKVCSDYDICVPCHVLDKHGHNPAHSLEPATKNTFLDGLALSMLAPGRGMRHHAICDGCDTTIYGERHKCLNCPDWDFCSQCFKSANRIHPGHRFVAVYEPLCMSPISAKVTHHGIYCDGPLCKSRPIRWVQGDRYKCTICDDIDFCADCEAHPSNTHNRTHPLIKLKTAVRKLTCTTDENDGSSHLGDLMRDIRSSKGSTMRETTHAATQVQTIADVEPSKEFDNKLSDKDIVVKSDIEASGIISLEGEFQSDLIDDGTMMAPGEHFCQTWILKNSGVTKWPIGVSVRFVGGDHMFGSKTADEATSFATTQPVEPGEVAAFSVDLVAPEFPKRRAISYWRLTAPDGSRFGHKIWCDIEVQRVFKEEALEDNTQKSVEVVSHSFLDAKVNQGKPLDESVSSSSSSEMVFPKLEKESVIFDQAPSSSETETEACTFVRSIRSASPSSHPSPMNSPAWTLTLSEDDGHISDPHTSEDDVESLMLDDEEYEVLETSDDDGYNRVI